VFQLEVGNGNILEYGGTEKSRVEDFILEHVPSSWRNPTVELKPIVNRERYAWALSSVKNRFNQSASFTYDLTFFDNPDPMRLEKGVEQVLKSLAYERYAIDLAYEDRPDPTERYVRGMRLRQTKRLIGIKVSADGRLVTEYRLGYEKEPAPATKRSRLARFQECDGKTVCKAPIKFHWQDPDLTYVASGKGIRLDNEFNATASTLAL
jgi:hypothetical protein